MVFKCCADEIREERMGTVGAGTEFRVELHPHKPRMVFNFDYLDQLFIGGDAREGQARIFKLGPVVVVKFIAVAVPLVDHFFSVQLPAFGA